MDGIRHSRGDSRGYEDVSQCLVEWGLVSTDRPLMTNMEEFLDPFEAAFPDMEKGRVLPSFTPASLELSGDYPVALTARKIVGKDLVLGTGGAFLAHVIVAIAVLLMPFAQPARPIRDGVINVYLADAELTGKGAEGAASGAAAGNRKHTEGPVPCEKAAVPDVPKDVKKAERVVSKTAVRKKPVLGPGIKQESCPPPSPADSREHVPAAEQTAAENTGTHSGRGQEQSAKSGNGTGEGPGLSGAGNSSGTGNTGEFDATRVDRVPQVLKKVEPAYPNRARSLGICGKVVVRFLVETDGRVSKPSIVEARPAGYFEQNALEAVRQWRFKPGYLGGRAVAAWVTLPVQFRLVGQD